MSLKHTESHPQPATGELIILIIIHICTEFKCLKLLLHINLSEFHKEDIFPPYFPYSKIRGSDRIAKPAQDHTGRKEQIFENTSI